MACSNTWRCCKRWRTVRQSASISTWVTSQNSSTEVEHADVTDILYMQRISQLEDQQGRDSSEAVDKFLPDDLRRRYEVNFNLPDDTKCIPIRQVRAEHVGTLVRVRGVVTRVSDVKPTATTITYTCDKCGCEAYQE